MISADDLHDRFQRLYQDSHQRLGSYSRCREAYFGNQNRASTLAQDTLGRPILRYDEIRADLKSRRGAPNLLAPIVDNFVAYKGQLPMLRVLPTEESDEGEERARARTRALRQQFDHSDMETQMIDAAWYLSCLGDAVITLDPLFPEDSGPFDEPGVYFTVYSPEICFPVFHTGRRRAELRELFICWDLSVDQVRDQYPEFITTKGDEDIVTCLTYYSGSERVVMVDNHVVRRYQHDLTFVPVQWLRNKQTGGELAQADIAQVIDVHEETQALTLVMSDATMEAVYAPIIVKDALNMPGDRMVFGRGKVITLGSSPQAMASRLEPAPPPTAAANLLSELRTALFEGSGTAPVQIENSHSGSNLSGRYMHAEQQPMETRLALNQTIVGYHLSQIGQKALYMLGALRPLAQFTFHIQGQDQGKSYSYDVSGADLGGVSKVTTKWDSLVGSTRHERFVMGLQGLAQGILPPTYVIEQLGEDDPEGMLRRAILEMTMLKGMQADAQGGPGPQQSPGDNQNAINAPADQAANAASGAQPSPNNPPGGAPPGAEGAPPPPQPQAPPQAPPFPQLSAPPNLAGMGPPPQSPDPIVQERAAIAALPQDVAATIVGSPVFVNGSLTVYVTDRRQVANGIIKRAFHDVGLDVKVKVAAAA